MRPLQLDTGGPCPSVPASRVLLLDLLIPAEADSNDLGAPRPLAPVIKRRRKAGAQRAGRPRGAKPVFAEVATLNTSGRPQLFEALRHFKDNKAPDGSK